MPEFFEASFIINKDEYSNVLNLFLKEDIHMNKFNKINITEEKNVYFVDYVDDNYAAISLQIPNVKIEENNILNFIQILVNFFKGITNYSSFYIMGSYELTMTFLTDNFRRDITLDLDNAKVPIIIKVNNTNTHIKIDEKQQNIFTDNIFD